MALTRFSVSLDEGLVRRFDERIREEGCPTRSKAVGDLIRESLVQSEWAAGEEIAGSIVMVFDHHKSDLSRKLTSIQHDYHKTILSSQHIHLDHDNCLETVIVRGRAKVVNELVRRLKAVKGIKHVALAAATTGEQLP
jgi:CopG family nickel-responsive transcriptional regulator